MLPNLETNKKNVVEFYDLIINKKDFESAGKYMGDHYKQHNPRAADDPDGLRIHVENLKANFPDVRSESGKSSRKEITSYFTCIHDEHRNGSWRSLKYSG